MTHPVKDATAILKLIETVDPSDTAKLDEIDARVWCWINTVEFVKLRRPGGQKGYEIPRYAARLGGSLCDRYITKSEIYTRSRDALKSIRPEGLTLEVESRGIARARHIGRFFKIVLRDECLAELHAIIQAIEYERNNK